MELPLVSVICLCYNHARFVKEAIASVRQQTHPRVQLVVVDDASTDNSVQVIGESIRDYPEITFLSWPQNIGNCRAFNKGFAMSTGSFIIDLAADDVLMPNRLAAGINAFASLGPDFGVHFSDAELIDAGGNRIGYHADRFPHASIPQGDIYKDLISRYFINSPTMMMRRSVLEKLGGYDESLAYEDFDFWIRSSREWKFGYTPEPLVKKRIVKNSMSGDQYRKDSIQLVSTFLVCEKILHLNRTMDETKALNKRIRYELRKVISLGEWSLALRYFKLLLRNRG
jgi:glycosyltransferase involved in cell wall biosynthesis